MGLVGEVGPVVNAEALCHPLIPQENVWVLMLGGEGDARDVAKASTYESRDQNVNGRNGLLRCEGEHTPKSLQQTKPTLPHHFQIAKTRKISSSRQLVMFEHARKKRRRIPPKAKPQTSELAQCSQRLHSGLEMMCLPSRTASSRL